jgi:HlyD family secretion protein
MPKSIIYVLTLGAALLAGLVLSPVLGIFGAGRHATAEPDAGTDSARPLSGEAVAALGRIEPASRVVDVGGPSGVRLATLRIQEGDAVQAGDELATLETHGERQADRERVAAQLKEARAQLETVTTQGQSLIRQAEIELQKVEELQPLQIDAQAAKMRQAEAELAATRRELERSRRLAKGGVITDQQLDDLIDRELVQIEAVASARAVLAELQASFKVEKELATAALTVRQSSLAVDQAAIAVQSLERSLEVAEAAYERTIIRAPSDGRILKILTWPGERIDAEPLLQIADLREMHAVAEVYVTDIGLIRLGQRATVRSPSLPEDLTGEVAEIGMVIFKNDVLDVDPAADVDARVVEVRIRLDRPELVERLTNLQVDVEIHLDPAAADVDSPGNSTGSH